MMRESMGKLLLPEPGSVLPHRASLLLLREVVSCGEQAVVAQARVSAGSKFSELEWVPTIMVVEMAAQAAAYHASLPGFMQGGAADEKGLLVRVRGIEILAAQLPVGQTVDLRVDLLGKAGGLAVYDFVATSESEAVARGGLSILRA